MEKSSVSSDHVIAELIEIGFEFSQVIEAVESVGPTLDKAVDFIINPSNHHKKPSNVSTGSLNLPVHLVADSSITDHFQPPRLKRSRIEGEVSTSVSEPELLSRSKEVKTVCRSYTGSTLVCAMEIQLLKASDVLQKLMETKIVLTSFFRPNLRFSNPSETNRHPINPQDRLKLLEEPFNGGPTIVYVPTRKETVALAKYFCMFGIRAAAYNAKLPKVHLRKVHKEFHENSLEVVVATIAFGMGIDKSNVWKIIHYGRPQSLEAYYQEAGRAGRDGKLADCILYANLSRTPTLLPSKRSEEQTKKAYKMLSDCFRFVMGNSTCRAKTLGQYFGEDFGHGKCVIKTDIFLRILAAQREHTRYGVGSYDENYFPKFAATDRLWWQGLARVLEDKGLTELGLKFLQSDREAVFHVCPEADILLSTTIQKYISTFSEWGKGWADPEIRRRRLKGKKCRKGRRKKRPSKHNKDLKTVRERLSAKLSKQKP
ncbi:hypothetical protein MKX01_042733 [Papaver californicum]|nr:hypothetical protein MKX01_042733 [Papaver californicum]